jgi:hypothetical protein
MTVLVGLAVGANGRVHLTAQGIPGEGDCGDGACQNRDNANPNLPYAESSCPVSGARQCEEDCGVCDSGGGGNSGGGSTAECGDGLDNDSDGAADYPADKQCGSLSDDTEWDPQCSNRIDDDGDGAVDHGADSDCASTSDDNEAPGKECGDGVDNDYDGQTDYPADQDCIDEQDEKESPPTCNDGYDNDDDGKTDYPADEDCSDLNDENESTPECSNGTDDDEDGLLDYSETDGEGDPECTSADDEREFTDPKCSDGQDNDGDSLTDYPDDPECKSADYNSEQANQCDDRKDENGNKKEYDNCGSYEYISNTCRKDGSFEADFTYRCGPDYDSTHRQYPHEYCFTCDADGSGLPDCVDGEDNDGDGVTDYPADKSCDSKFDTDEAVPAQCSDGEDNDDDGLVDYSEIDGEGDPDCDDADDNDEAPPPECGDGEDNDNDGLPDKDDPQCHTDGDAENDDTYDSTIETETGECNDGEDNDGDGDTDGDDKQCQDSDGNHLPELSPEKEKGTTLGFCGTAGLRVKVQADHPGNDLHYVQDDSSLFQVKIVDDKGKAYNVPNSGFQPYDQTAVTRLNPPKTTKLKPYTEDETVKVKKRPAEKRWVLKMTGDIEIAVYKLLPTAKDPQARYVLAQGDMYTTPKGKQKRIYSIIDFGISNPDFIDLVTANADGTAFMFAAVAQGQTHVFNMSVDSSSIDRVFLVEGAARNVVGAFDWENTKLSAIKVDINGSISQTLYNLDGTEGMISC